MSVLAFDFYAPDDPDTLLGTLDDSQLEVMEIRPALFELGAGLLRVSRHSDDIDPAYFQKGTIVRVRIPTVDTDAIWGWVLKDGDFPLVTHREQAGEDLIFSGPGLLYMLSWARLREDHFAPGQPARGSYDVDNQWTWKNEPYGAILTRGVEEGQNQPGTPLEHVTLDFNRVVDSDGLDWDVIAEEFIAPIGTDILSLANRLATAGDLYLEMTPDLVLHAYQSKGRDLTGSFGAGNVRFEKGVNLLTELTRKTRKDSLTHLITRDANDVYAVHVIPGFSGQAKYGFLEIGQTNDATQVAKIAQQLLASSDTESEEYDLEITPGDDEAAGRYLPGPEGSTNGHFWPGDTVTVHTGTGEHDLNASEQRVVAVRITTDKASDDSTTARAHRSLHVVPELSFRASPAYEWREKAEDGTGIPGYCCGAPVCSGTTVVGGDGILAFDWEDEPDHEETIPAIAALGQPTKTLGPASDGAGILEGLYRISMTATLTPPDDSDIGSTSYVWFHATPGTSYNIDLEYLTFSHLSGVEIGAVWIQWVSGDWQDYVHISNEYVTLPREGSLPVHKAFTVTAPTGAVGFMLYQGREDGADRGWHMHGITIVEGGTIVECPPNAAAPHDHTHDALHSTHSVEELLTEETDDTLVLAPDGAGGVEWVTPAGGGGGAPTTADYLVGSAQAGLSAEIVVGTSPGGELGGTWAAPTVDATHSGSSHAGVVSTHEAAADPHTGYRLESADHSHASSGLQGGTIDHGALTGLADDDHPQYVTNAEHSAIDHGGIVGSGDWDTKIVAAADQDVTNNATPQNSTEITVALDANSVYELEFCWIWSCSQATAKARWRIQSSTAIIWDGRAAQGYWQSLSTAGAVRAVTEAIGASAGGTQWPATDNITDLPSASDGLDNRYTAIGRLTYVTGGTAPTLTLQFANNATGAGNTTRLNAGSVLRVRKLAGAP